MGHWEGALKCRSGDDRVALDFGKIQGAVKVSYASSQSKSDAYLTAQEGAGRYKVVAVVSGVPVLQALHLEQIPGTLSVSDDPDDEDSPGRDYLAFSAGLRQAIRFLGSAKLRRGYRTLSYQVRIESALYSDLCSGILKKSAVVAGRR